MQALYCAEPRCTMEGMCDDGGTGAGNHLPGCLLKTHNKSLKFKYWWIVLLMHQQHYNNSTVSAACYYHD